jgi:bacteriocin biosynthesis cyclodehydratase domain-containing protein
MLKEYKNMIKNPIFKAHYQVSPIPGEGVLLLSEDGAKALHGPIYEAVAPLLDGQHSTDAIVSALAERIDAAKVYYALMLLEKNGYIAEHVPDMPPETAAFWYGLGLHPHAARDALHRQAVNLIVLADAFEAPVRKALAELDITVADNGQGVLDLVLADDYLRPSLFEHNRAALADARSWILAKPCGRDIWIGPLFIPGQTACYECLRPRLERNQIARHFAAGKRELGKIEPMPAAMLPSTLALAARLLALEAAKHLAGRVDSPLLGKVLSLNLASFETQSHTLVRDPHCAGCGEAPAATPPAPVALMSRKAAFVQDGGHRAVSPEHTLRQYRHLVSPITGVVRVLEPFHQADGIAHVYVAGHNPAVRRNKLEFLRRGLRNFSAGKGISGTQAKVSALCEAIERYSGEYTGREYRIAARYRDLRADAVHPAACMLFSERQYRERDAWNTRESKFNWVPEPFDDDRRVNWSPVWSLTEQRHKYLPTQYLYYAAKAADDCDTSYCIGCSNGNASGNNLEEAILQGICELVERDAVALWWYNRLRKPGVDVASFGEPYLLDLIAHYDSLDRDVWALDITSDLGLPTFVAVSRSRGGAERILFGLGCHLDARIALQRAFAEMNQMLGLASGGPEGTETGLEDIELLNWLKTATLENQPYLAPDSGRPPRRHGDYPQLANGDLLENIRLCQRLVEEKGMEMLVLDQTRPDTGLPVVKVIVPGLRHFWARFAPGRLYDVPVRMGWLDEPLSEDRLNPIPIFL